MSKEPICEKFKKKKKKGKRRGKKIYPTKNDGNYSDRTSSNLSIQKYSIRVVCLFSVIQSILSILGRQFFQTLSFQVRVINETSLQGALVTTHRICCISLKMVMNRIGACEDTICLIDASHV